MTQNYGMKETGAYTPDALFSGAHPVVEIPVAIHAAAGAKLSRGQVLGQITANGKYAAYNKTGNDGTQTPKAILGADTTGPAQAFAYVHGEFNKSALKGTNIDAACLSALQAVGVYVK